MSFATPVFLWYFLPLTLLATWIAPTSYRNAVISIASLVFYAVGAGKFTLLLLAGIALNFLGGLLLDPARSIAQRDRRLVLTAFVTTDLGILGLWKYADFASQQIHDLGRMLGLSDTPVLAVALPIGISFFTFHQISYIVDVYRGTAPTQRNILTFVMYVAMFPQLIAGPIVRYNEIADQLGDRKTSKLDDLIDGFPRFCLGLAKKVVVADSVAPLVSAAFNTPGAELNTRTAWLGTIAYTVQIYFDFSGYSDMAIGLGRMLGLQLPENFARPYSATSITDFWHRWHMSLSRWFRDYVYIPLGGNRQGRWRTYVNLWTVFILVGFWHGANWTFVLWGIYHGALLVIERATKLGGEPTGLVRRRARRALTLLLVSVGWVLFRSDSVDQAMSILGHMFWLDPGSLAPSVRAVVTHQRELILVLACLVVTIPPAFVTGRFVQFGKVRSATVARVGIVALGGAAATMLVTAGSFSPFLYYKF